MENINLIRKIAWEFHYRTGIEFKELYSEATLAYLEAKQSHEIDKEKSYLNYHQTFIKNRLINFCKAETKNRQFISSELSEVAFLKVSQLPFFELYDVLPKNCRQVSDVVLSNPKKFITGTPKASRGLVIKHLREQGWPWNKIWDSFRELKMILQETPESYIIE